MQDDVILIIASTGSSKRTVVIRDVSSTRYSVLVLVLVLVVVYTAVRHVSGLPCTQLTCFHTGAHVDPPKWTFFRETIFRSLGGAAWPLKFLHMLGIDQGLLAHTLSVDGGPPLPISC